MVASGSCLIFSQTSLLCDASRAQPFFPAPESIIPCRKAASSTTPASTSRWHRTATCRACIYVASDTDGSDAKALSASVFPLSTAHAHQAGSHLCITITRWSSASSDASTATLLQSGSLPVK
eukprot:3005057-Rhodomonas_salina.1